MVERTQPNLDAALETLRERPDKMSVDDRRSLVKAIEDAILSRSAGEEPIVVELLDLLACDPDWSVRLEVARLLHLLDDEACSRLAAIFRQDANSYVWGPPSQTLREVCPEEETKEGPTARRADRPCHGQGTRHPRE
ncbi:MAG: hypothetical protein GXY74_01525 [Phycisphaerae bacterium]|jgi:HEAT repeat protein|nr:hypothetical protein [Phycisphaerae bacterium]